MEDLKAKRDHPRSRGDYYYILLLFPSCLGIIPARAGTTTVSHLFSFIIRDHPRSRGDYYQAPAVIQRLVGSSPLARGLQANTFRFVCRFGIIPARAGTTYLMLLPILAVWDHPRSRGDYHTQSKTEQWATGSSPLARGLLIYHFPFGLVGGIIPARAGTTLVRLV